MGLLIPISEFNNPFVDLPGAHVADLLGIKKYEPPVEWWQTNADAVKEPPVGAPVYDIEGVRRYPTILRPGEEVYVTEKIHGTNARFLFHDGEFFVGSHKRWLKETDNLWWRIAKKYEMQTMCKAYPDVIFFGEIFGPGIQDMTYGLKEPEIRFFDLFDTRSRSYFGFLDWFDTFCDLALPVVPLLEVAPYSDSLLAMAEGQSVIRGANHIREGIVIKPTIERLDVEIGRVILKLPSESYLLRKENEPSKQKKETSSAVTAG